MDNKVYNIRHAQLLLNCMREAGSAVMEIYNSPDLWVEAKADKSPLTSADLKANAIIQAHLKDTGIPVLSEESKQAEYQTRKHWKHCWIVDPIDGTKEFIKKNGQFTINVALAEQGKSVLGVVYAPALDVLYIGEEGQGAYMIESFSTSDAVTTVLPRKQAERPYTVVASKSHASPETEAFIETLRAENGPDIALKSMGSSLKICLVATGDADIYPRFAPTSEWDTAAGHAVVKAAGKNIYFSASNNELVYNKENLLNPHFIVK